jgi:hypothetical protein
MTEYKIKALFKENAAEHAEFNAKLEQLEAENTAYKLHLEAIAAKISTFDAKLNRMFILLETMEEEEEEEEEREETQPEQKEEEQEETEQENDEN